MPFAQRIPKKYRLKFCLMLAIGGSLYPAVVGAFERTSEPSSVERSLPKASVATEHETATRAAISVMRRGGNAVDAAVAAALVTGVVAPSSSGLGGGGFALVWLADSRTAQFLDFRERAPEHLPVTELDSRPLADERRGLLVGVPGEPAGLYELQTKYGRLAFSEVTEEAARLGDQGFRAGLHLAHMTRSSHASRTKLAILRALGFGRGGVAAGSWVRSPLLARTLRRLGELGPRALLEGAIAEDWVAAVREQGGVLSLADLLAYQPRYRSVLRVRYGQFEVITAPPPSAGGLLLAQTLGTCLVEDLVETRLPDARIHLLAEAYRAALEDRFRHIGDPDFVKVDVARLLNPASLSARRASFRPQETRPYSALLPKEQGTSHISVLDAQGNAVALTTTVNNAFGSKILGSSSGVILNDELDDFGHSGTPNQPRPLARPVSSMTPTIVLDDQAVRLVLGGSGGMTIATNVSTVLLSILVDGVSPRQAVEQPRFIVEPTTGSLLLEEGFPEQVARGLRARGEHVRFVPRGISAVQVVARSGSRDSAAADSRKHGSAESTAITPMEINSRPRHSCTSPCRR